MASIIRTQVLIIRRYLDQILTVDMIDLIYSAGSINLFWRRKTTNAHGSGVRVPSMRRVRAVRSQGKAGMAWHART